MRKKVPLFCLFIFLLQGTILFAQNGVIIKGRITEKSTGEPLPGVNIVEMNAQNRVINGMISDVNGNYAFEVSDMNSTIQISYIGYEGQTFTIDGREQIDIVLKEESMDIEEVVVIAVSSANSLTGVHHRDQTSSSVKVDMSKIGSVPSASVAGALQGQVAGLDIMSASGNPGSGSSIVIRGMGSVGNANPLIVVDGIPQDIGTGNFNFAAADQHDLGQLLNIPPQDIKSVEVLKDAASTAVWGSKGANGVLLIETHLGVKGKILFNYQYKVNANLNPPSIPMLNGDEYITLQLEELHNAYGVYDIPSEIAYDRNYVDFYNYSANTNWIDELTKNSYTHDHFFKISGGGQKSRYYTSVNYNNSLGTTLNTSYKRFSFRANFSYSISDDLRFTTYFNYNNSLNENNPNIYTPNLGWKGVREMAYMKAPNMSIWEYDEEGNPSGEYFTPIESYQGSGDNYFNPVAVANLGMNDMLGNQIQNNFKIDYDIAEWLKFQENISFSYDSWKGNQFVPSNAIGVDWLGMQKNQATERNTMDIRWLSRSQFFISPFSQSLDHVMNGVLMWEMEQKQNEWMQIGTGQSPSIFITDPASNAPILFGNGIHSSSSESRMYGALASLNYKYRDKYMASFNLRGDGSSAFGENNHWGFFPSVSVGWRFSKEQFLQDVEFLNESKLRFSWGQAGKALSNPYASFAYYETSGQYMEEPIVVPAQIELSNLRWQTVSSWNAGIDLTMFKNRLNLTGELYRKVTSDLLWTNYNIPLSTGYTTLAYYNGGEIQNEGWELFLQGIVIDREKLRWSLNFNISQNNNSFLSFPDNFNMERGTSIGNGTYPRKAEIGKPIGSFYGFRFLGVYATKEDAIAKDINGNQMIDGNGDPIPMTYKDAYEFEAGDAIYEDINHDGVIDIMDAVYIGDSSPRFMGGFGSTFRYKQLTASLHFHYRLGFDIVNQVAINSEGMLNRNNQSKAVLHRWKWEGQVEDGLLPRAYLGHPCNNLGSDRYVEAGDFLRLNTIDITYRFVGNITERFHIGSIDVGLNIRKLLTFTNYSGQDPEIGRVGTDPFFLGQDNARTPNPKILSLLINVNF